jgi:O-antigen ligase
MLIVLIPATFVSVGWFLHEPALLLSSTVFVVLTLISLITYKKIEIYKKWILLTPILIPLGYLISAVVNSTEIHRAILGAYGRSYGLATITALSITVYLAMNSNEKTHKKLIQSLFLTLILAVIYAYLQYLDLDPLPWSNQFDATTLTLGNPNFAGAFIGITSITCLSLIAISPKTKKRFLYLLVFVLAIPAALTTKTLQAPLILSLMIISFGIFINGKNDGKKEKIIRRSLTSILALGSFFIVLISFYPLRTFRDLKQRIIQNGSIEQRLDYWQTGLDIWQNNKFFGVGIDDFQRFAAEFRTSKQIMRDGVSVTPDKAHSVLIDQFATGGILVGLIWVIFVISTTYFLFRINQRDLNRMKRVYFSTFATIWIGYLAQSLISPDHVILTLIGYISAGVILGLYFNQELNTSNTEFSNIKKFSIDGWVVKTFGSVLLILLIPIYTLALSGNSEMEKILKGKVNSVDEVNKSIEKWPFARPIELLMISQINSNGSCSLINDWADQLLKLDDRSYQAWYSKAICATRNLEYQNAELYVENALRFDPLNTNFLIGKARIEIVLGDLKKATAAVDFLEKNYPTNAEVPKLRNLLSDLSDKVK